MTTQYIGARSKWGTVVLSIDQTGNPHALPVRLDVRSHSPCGFEWGYQGSGPAQLALALLCDALGDEQRAEWCYQSFKRDVIAKLKGDVWLMTRQYILDWYAGHQ